MKLYVTDRVMDVGLDCIAMPIEEFIDISSHPFIASSHFDTVVIDLDDRIPHGIIGNMLGITKVIPRIIDDMTVTKVRLLSEIYPELSAKLRVSFMRDKDGFVNVINDIKKQFEWESFY